MLIVLTIPRVLFVPLSQVSYYLICEPHNTAVPGQDSCQGDSGGPLIGRTDRYSDKEKRYSWIGIVSFGVGCAEPGYPGAYTRTSCFLGFIAEQFGLTAEFPRGNAHPGWSTDCPRGASRRSSATNRYILDTVPNNITCLY